MELALVIMLGFFFSCSFGSSSPYSYFVALSERQCHALVRDF